MNKKLLRSYIKFVLNENEESIIDKNTSQLDIKSHEEDSGTPAIRELEAFLRKNGYSGENFLHKKTSAYVTRFKLLVPLSTDGRRELVASLKNGLEDMGYVYDHTFDSTGRFENIKNPKDKIHFMIKPSGSARSRPQDVGEQYEKDLEKSVSSLLGNDFKVTTAGFGHGSDIVIKSKDGTQGLSIEAKTSPGADFGQGSARFNKDKNDWEINPTRQMVHNKDKYALFITILGTIRDKKLLPDFSSLDAIGIGTDSKDYGDIYIAKDNKIYGLRRSEKTKQLSQLIQQEWFNDKESLYISYNANTITKYYASKGDDLMQIKGYGLYGLNEAIAKKLKIPMFHEGITGQIRFRLKHHGGAHGKRSFTIANQIRGALAQTHLSLDREEDLHVISKALKTLK